MTRRSATTSLTIRVVNVVFAPPTFSESVYTFEIAEGTHANVCMEHNVANGTSIDILTLQEEVGVVRAVDTTSPSTGIIRYEQISRGKLIKMSGVS